MNLVCTIFHNNNGVALIRRGCYGEAIKECSKALELLRDLLQRSTGNECASDRLPDGNAVDSQSDHSFSESRGRQLQYSETSSETTSLLDSDIDNPNRRQDDQKDATSTVRQPPRQTSSGTSCQEDSVFSPLWENRIMGLDGSSINGSTSHSDEENRDADSSTGGRFVFRDAILVPSRMLSQKNISDGLLMRLSIVIPFNLALSFHLNALHSGNWSHLLRAKTLYEHVFYLHLDDDSGSTLLYSMALLNNLGIIYEICNENEKTKACFQSLLSTMMTLLESQEAQNIKQWGGLWSNAIRPIISLDNAASAA